MTRQRRTTRQEKPAQKKSRATRSAPRAAPKKKAATKKPAARKGGSKRKAAAPKPSTGVVSVRKSEMRPMGMPFIQVVVDHPSSDLKITLPYTADGTNACSGGANVHSMQYQIDEYSPKSKNFSPKAINNFSDTSWSFTITSSDCPLTGETYLLTVYASDGSNSFPSQAVYFSV